MADETYISFEQASEFLGVDEDQLLNLVASNDLRAFRINREMKFKEADVQAFAKKGSVGSDSVDLEELPDDIVLVDSEGEGDLPDADDIGIELMDSDDAGVELLDSDDAGVELMDSDDAGVELLDSDDAGVELLDSDDAGVELLDIDEGDDLPQSAPEEDISFDEPEAEEVAEIKGSDVEEEEFSFDEEEDGLKELDDVGELDFEEAAMDSGEDAEATIQMTDEDDDFDSETEPLLEAPDETDGLGTEEIIFDDEDLEIGGDDDFGLGTEEATIQEDTLDDELEIDEDSDADMTVLVDDDDDDLSLDDDDDEDDDEIGIDDDDDEQDAGGSRKSGRSSRRSASANMSSMRRRNLGPVPAKGSRGNPIWTGILVILVLAMIYPIFLFVLMAWKGPTTKVVAHVTIDRAEINLYDIGAVVPHDWFKWFPKVELGEKKELPYEWWGVPQEFEGVGAEYPKDFVPVEDRIAESVRPSTSTTTDTPAPAPTEPATPEEEPATPEEEPATPAEPTTDGADSTGGVFAPGV